MLYAHSVYLCVPKAKKRARRDREYILVVVVAIATPLLQTTTSNQQFVLYFLFCLTLVRFVGWLAFLSVRSVTKAAQCFTLRFYSTFSHAHSSKSSWVHWKELSTMCPFFFLSYMYIRYIKCIWKTKELLFQFILSVYTYIPQYTCIKYIWISEAHSTLMEK